MATAREKSLPWAASKGARHLPRQCAEPVCTAPPASATLLGGEGPGAEREKDTHLKGTEAA